jgi:lipopolysaccharide/colanic/teichoic acid biosynthesis glycosyltransferase
LQEEETLIVKRSFADITADGNLPTIPGTDHRILDEELFHRSICLERKRAERTRRSFVLMLLDLSRLRAADSDGQAFHKVLNSLSRLIRETDNRGWHRSETVLGILFTDLDTEGRNSAGNTLLSRVNGVLYKSLTFEEFSQITISHYTFPEDWDPDVPQRPSDPTLYPDLEQRENGTKLYSIVKRAVDLAGSIFGLLLCAPLLLMIALAIKLNSKGPVLFRQQRIGQFGTPFVFLKFRSMHLDNDSVIHRRYIEQLISGKAERQPSNGNGKGVYKLTNDPRVTRVGAFLRKTSLDELPQLWNVLRGEMSLVGPRPPIPYEVQAYQTWHRRRVLEARPGITGLWQVSGRSRVSFDEMVRLDVRYAMQRSFWLDMKILLLTPAAVISGEGAH